MKRIWSITCSLFLAMSTAVVPLHAEERNRDLDDLMQSEFRDTLEQDYTTAHYRIKNYSDYGIEKPEVTFGHIDDAYFQKLEDDAKNVLEALEKIDVSALSSSQQQDYYMMKHCYEDQLSTSCDRNYTWLFTPGSNLIQNISTNMIEFPFYTHDDFYDYVTLLKSATEYLEEALTLTRTQAENGYFMNKESLQETLDTIDSYIQKEENPMVTEFEKKADASTFLTDGEKVDLKTQVQEYVQNEFLPECQKVYTTLQSLQDHCIQGSEYSLKDGKTYYEESLKDISGTTDSLQEELDDLTDFLKDSLKEMFASSSYSDGIIQHSDPEEILTYLKEHMGTEGFEDIGDYTYTLDSVDPSVVSSGTVAYYVLPNLDDWQNNVIKINESNVSDSMDLYTTLAHEGIPGHLYQNVYYLRTNPQPLRSLLSTLSYSEGWAMYAELQALDMGVLTEEEATYQKAYTKVNYALIGAISLGVNGKGWEEEDVRDFMESLNLNADSADSYYNLALTYPDDYIPYAYGMMRMCTLEQEARNSLGNRFREEEFHKVILEDGPRYFDEIEKQVDAYAGMHERKVSFRNYLLVTGGAGILVIGAIRIVSSAGRKKENKR